MTDAALDVYARIAAHDLGEAICLVNGCAAMLADTDPNSRAA